MYAETVYCVAPPFDSYSLSKIRKALIQIQDREVLMRIFNEEASRLINGAILRR